jgi:hypothetical protein
LSRPKSALAVVTDFVRASTHIPNRNISREALVVSPESQAAFTESNPFAAQAESFFIDDYLDCPPDFDIYDLGIYADAGSTLNLQVPRRKRTAVGSEQSPASFRSKTNSYEREILAKRLGQECRRTLSFSTATDTPLQRPRTSSGLSHLSGADISSGTPVSVYPPT